MTPEPHIPPRPLPPFDVCVQGSEMAVREALAKVLAGLGPLDLDVEEAGTIELVLAEALNNIVEHAYAPNAGVGPIRICCLHKKDGLHLRIQDEGLEMPDGQLPLGQPVSLPDEIAEMPEGGFGWFLIQDLAKDVRYRRVENGNELSLRLAIGMLPGAR